MRLQTLAVPFSDLLDAISKVVVCAAAIKVTGGIEAVCANVT